MKRFLTWLGVWSTFLLLIPGAWVFSEIFQKLAMAVMGKWAWPIVVVAYHLYIGFAALLLSDAFFKRGDLGLQYTRDWISFAIVGTFYFFVAVTLAAVCAFVGNRRGTR